MYKYLELNIRDLYYNCCDDKKVFLDNMIYIKDNYNRKIHNLTSYTPYDIYHFMHNIRGSFDNDNMVSDIRISSDDLLDGICKLLDINHEDLNEEETIKIINENIEKLRKIKDKSLKSKYPKLYDMFQQGLGMYHKWNSIEFLDPSKDEDKELTECKFCHKARYKTKNMGRGKHKNIPVKRMHYLPLIPRLKRLYASMRFLKMSS